MFKNFVSYELMQVYDRGCGCAGGAGRLGGMRNREGKKLDLHVISASFHNPVLIIDQQIIINLLHIDPHILIIIVLIRIGWQAQTDRSLTPLITITITTITTFKYGSIKLYPTTLTTQISKS